MAEAKETKEKIFDVKKYLSKHGKAKTKIKLNDRKAVIILADSGFYRKDKVITPHVTFADELIAQGIAKEYKAPKEEAEDGDEE